MKSKSNLISIIIADPHDIFLAGFASLIHKFPFIKDVAVAQNKSELITLLMNAEFQIVLIDANLPPVNGIDPLKNIHRLFPELKTIGMSMTNNPAIASGFLAAGAKGFILKTISSKNLSHALETVAVNKTYICKETKERMLSNTWNNIAFGENHYLQTEKMRELLFLICHEFTSKEIADRMNISEKTVEKYRKELIQATGSKNMVGLALFAVQNNIHIDQDLQKKFELLSA